MFEFKPHPQHPDDAYKLVPRLGVRYGLKTLVETGSHVGDMVAACLGQFDRIYSIELSDDYYAFCRGRFWGNPSVRIIRGDSSVELPRLLETLSGPCLFWIDAHGNDPVEYAVGDTESAAVGELPAVAAYCRVYRGCVVMVDDMHLAGGKNGYMRQDEIEALFRACYPEAQFERNGIILVISNLK